MARINWFSSETTSQKQPTNAAAPTGSPMSQEEFLSRFDVIFSVTRPPPARTSSSSRSSRDHEKKQVSSFESLPPPYGSPEHPAPAYNTVQEPITLAKALFQYGFALPLFWLVGAIIIFVPLRPVPENECGKTAAEQVEALAILRQAELRWAKRCAIALAVFLVIIGFAILGLYLGHVGPFSR